MQQEFVDDFFCCDFASDEGTGEAQIVKNDDDPRDALAQLVD